MRHAGLTVELLKTRHVRDAFMWDNLGRLAAEYPRLLKRASRLVPVERLYPCTNCGMAPMDRSLAIRKLVALTAGAALARGRFG